MIEWFDDLKVGMQFKSEAITVSKQDILRFAREFDPQPFHLDEKAAKDTILGGLAASGWHTAAIAMKLATACRPFGPHPLFGAGVDELRWMKPVRPGDTLHLEGEVTELVPSKSKPQGVVRVKWTAYNQHGEAVYTFNPIGIVPRRPRGRADNRRRSGSALSFRFLVEFGHPPMDKVARIGGLSGVLFLLVGRFS